MIFIKERVGLPAFLKNAWLCVMKHWTRSEKIALWAYLGWMLIGLGVTPFQMTPGKLHEQFFSDSESPGFLEVFVGACLRNGDGVLMILAALNTHFMLTRHWGLRAARRWAGIVLVVSAVVETIGTLTGFPFGAYQYTDYFGARIGGVLPLTIPLAWYVVVSNALIGVKVLKPEYGKCNTAIAVGTLAAFFDYVMEPFATRIKAYWLWENGVPPLQNYLAWWGLSAFLVWRFGVMRLDDLGEDWRPGLILGSMTFLFILTRFVHGI